MLNAVLTNLGQELLTRVLSGETKITFTRIVSSSHTYLTTDIKNIVDLQNPQQEATISDVSFLSNSKVKVSANTDNSQLDNGYQLRAMALYAKDEEDNEIIYAVSLSGSTPSYVPDKSQPTGLIFNITVIISETDNIDITIDPTSYVSITTFLQHTQKPLESEEGVHDLRVNEGELEYRTGEGDWVRVMSGMPARVLVTVPSGSTITVSRGEKVITYSNVSETIPVDLYEYGTWHIESRLGNKYAETEITIDDVKIYEVSLNYLDISLNITYPEGADCVVIKNDENITTAPDKTGIWNLPLYAFGKYEIKATLGDKEDSTIIQVNEEKEYEVKLQFIPKPMSFGEISDDDLVELVRLSNEGVIDIYEYTGWDVGDERKMTLSAHGGIEDSETHAEQEVTWVILNKGGKNYSDEGAEVAYVLGLKNCLAETGKMNTTRTNVGGWKEAPRRSWCNNAFRGAIPENLRPIFKEYKNTQSKGGTTTSDTSTGLDTVNDYFSFPAEIEAFGSRSYSATDEASALAGSQWEYYKIVSNRIKKLGEGNVGSWWERSSGLIYSDKVAFCAGFTNGQASHAQSDVSVGLAPVGCIATKYIRGTIRVSYPDDATSCTLTKGDTVLTATANPFSFRNLAGGEWEIKIQKAGVTSTKKVLIHTNGQEEDIKMVWTASWSEGSDEVIMAMIEASNKGDLDLSEYWRVGDERVIHLNAMSAMSPLTDTHAEQDTTWVLMNKGGKICSDGTVGAFVVGMKDCLKESGAINSTDTNVGGWKDASRRTWCNSTFKDSIPESIRGIFKQHRNIASKGNVFNDSSHYQTGVNIVDDYFALPFVGEIMPKGLSIGCPKDEYEQYSQFDWYKTEDNRKKRRGSDGANDGWFTSSPAYSYMFAVAYCMFNSSGNISSIPADTSYNYYLSPRGVIGTLKIDATLHIKFEPGATCKVEGVGETYIAPDSSGSWDLKIDRGGVYTVTATGTFTKTKQISVVENGDMDVNLVYRVMSVVVDLNNSDSGLALAYEDDAVGMTPGSDEWDEFFGIYPVMVKDGVEGKRLDPNDFTKHLDGTPADITSGAEGDVMIKFPRRGVYVQQIYTNGNVNHFKYSMTDDVNSYYYENEAFKANSKYYENFYLAVYEGGLDSSSNLMSLSGKSAYKANIATSRTKATAKLNRFLMSDKQLAYLQVMFMLKYKDRNCQNVIGSGYTRTGHSSSTSTGGTEAYGMDSQLIKATNPSYMTDGNHNVKLFGIENLWGNEQQFIDGVYFSQNPDNQYTVKVNHANDISQADDYTSYKSGYTSFNTLTSLVFFASAEYDGFWTVPNSTARGGVYGSSTTFWCDGGLISSITSSTVKNFAKVGGGYADGDYSGLFCLKIDTTTSASSRLVCFAD